MTSTTFPTSASATWPTTSARRGRSLVAEWTKQRTLRSTWVATTISVLAAVALAALASASDARDWATKTAAERLAFDPTNTSLVGVLFTSLVLGSLGVRAVASEYNTGMIRTTATAIPRRATILWSKVAVTTAVTFVAALVANLAGFGVGQAILGREGIGVSITDGRNLGAIISGAVAVAAFAIIGVGLGTIVKRASLANILMAFVVIGGQIVGSAMPARAQRFLPFNALKATVSVEQADDVLAPGVGLAFLAGYAMVAVTAAAILVGRRDV